MAAARKAAPARATAAAKRAANVVDFDAARNKRKRPTYPLRAFGKVWHLKRPNQALIGELSAREDMRSLTEGLLAFVVKDERNAFLEAALAEENLDLEDVLELGDKMAEAVYADLPTPAS